MFLATFIGRAQNVLRNRIAFAYHEINISEVKIPNRDIFCLNLINFCWFQEFLVWKINLICKMNCTAAYSMFLLLLLPWFIKSLRRLNERANFNYLRRLNYSANYFLSAEFNWILKFYTLDDVGADGFMEWNFHCNLVLWNLLQFILITFNHVILKTFPHITVCFYQRALTQL